MKYFKDMDNLSYISDPTGNSSDCICKFVTHDDSQFVSEATDQWHWDVAGIDWRASLLHLCCVV